ncbi:MAG: glycosyltransferase family 4 protein [Planctomycetes bacterium]|nr:glycosyltransferase family 4 protein [Planctomycetota bacterium]
MKILVATQFHVPHGGGLSSHVEDLVSCLINAGHETELLEGSSAEIASWYKLLSFLLSYGSKDAYLHRRLEIHLCRLTKHIERLLINNSFDIIHCHDAAAGYATHLALYKTKQQIPVIETIHGPLAYEASMDLGKEIKDYRYLERLFAIEKEAFEKADHLIAVDTGQGNIAINDFGIDKEKISVIFNSVSSNAIDEIIKERPSIEIPKPYLLVPRRLVEKNGVRIAIESLAEFEGPDKINLAIAGNGPLRDDLESLTEKSGFGSQVFFLGSIARDEVLRLANEALAVVIPSIPSCGVIEATSIAAIEAMACGTTVIASNIGGLTELIEDNKTGFLVPHSSPQELANIIQLILEDKELNARVSSQGRKNVLENLDTPIWFKKVERIYEAVL